MADGKKIVNVNEASGNELWRWQSRSGNVLIIIAGCPTLRFVKGGIPRGDGGTAVFAVSLRPSAH
jgi:hypothetical protein